MNTCFGPRITGRLDRRQTAKAGASTGYMVFQKRPGLFRTGLSREPFAETV